MLQCPLCASNKVQFFHRDRRRFYHRCSICDLVFVDPQFLPTTDMEKSEYDLHQNCDDDLGYLRFLDRVRNPVLTHAKPLCNGLDYGCGPNPVLAKRLTADGYRMSIYDPFYYPSMDPGPYDFIVSTEAIEHFHYPIRDWQQWMQLLSKTGKLFVMTKRWLSREKFKTWHYKNDQTHVSFFHQNTFEYLAATNNLHAEFVCDDVVIMHRS